MRCAARPGCASSSARGCRRSSSGTSRRPQGRATIRESWRGASRSATPTPSSSSRGRRRSSPCLDQVSDPRNLGAVIRSAEGAGASGVVVPAHGSARVTAAVCRSSAGAVEHLPVAVVPNLARYLAEIKRGDLWIARRRRGVGNADVGGRPLRRRRLRLRSRGQGPAPARAAHVRPARSRSRSSAGSSRSTSASRPRFSCTRPGGSAMAETTLYLFDGFNLLHAGDFGSPEELRDLLASWVAAQGARGVLVFDGEGDDRAARPARGALGKGRRHAARAPRGRASERGSRSRSSPPTPPCAAPPGIEVRKLASQTFLARARAAEPAAGDARRPARPPRPRHARPARAATPRRALEAASVLGPDQAGSRAIGLVKSWTACYLHLDYRVRLRPRDAAGRRHGCSRCSTHAQHVAAERLNENSRICSSS